eukprot:COSAG02_NODE_11008_length_1819_cov_0.920653_4_plen_115_part_01
MQTKSASSRLKPAAALAIIRYHFDSCPRAARALRRTNQGILCRARPFTPERYAHLLWMSCINRALRAPKCAATHCAHGDAMAEQLIVATGADSRWLGVTNEHILRGHGVSSCATC